MKPFISAREKKLLMVGAAAAIPCLARPCSSLRWQLRNGSCTVA